MLLLHLCLAQPAAAQADRGAASAQDPAPAELHTRDQHYDRIEWFNDKMFLFNSAFDQFLLKPVALTYASIVPLPAQQGIRNAIGNLDVVRKVVNNTLQGRPVSASRELARFMINSTVGVAGIFDMATKLGAGAQRPGHGDHAGRVRGQPRRLSRVAAAAPHHVPGRRGHRGRLVDEPAGISGPLLRTPVHPRYADLVNSRALDRKLYEELELSIDPYSAARNAYLQIRARKLEAARSAGYYD